MTTLRSQTEAERGATRAIMDRLVPPVDDLPGAGNDGPACGGQDDGRGIGRSI